MYKKFLSYYQKNDYLECERLLDTLFDTNIKLDKEFTNELLRILKGTNDVALRNKISLVLADFKVEELPRHIMELLMDERTKGHRGTLVYSLTDYELGKYFSELINIILNDEFEARYEAECLIKKINPLLVYSNIDEEVKNIEKELEDLNDKVQCLEGLKNYLFSIKTM